MNESLLSPPRRAALFVDGDNLPPSQAGAIMVAASRLGQLDLRRAYAAEGAIKGWAAVPGLRALQVAGAKNGTDLVLCIDAVEAACEGGFQAFAIASDDRDFSQLAHWLRERGRHVLGIGTVKSPEGWRAACNDFAILEAQSVSRPDPPLLSDLDRHLKAAIGQKSVGKPMRTVGSLLAAEGVRPPEGGNWRAYMAKRPDLYDLDPSGPDARVRWTGGRAGPAKVSG